MSQLPTPGTRVRITTDAGRIGVATGRTRPRGGEILAQIQFPERTQFVPIELLEIVDSDHGDPLDLLRRGRLARPIDLRRTLTHARLSGRLANLIYSMNTTGADFYAYQFKPLVKLLTSATTGLLIADEVGLGKTIEAGLIWTELRSRFEFNRLLVLCPAMLREKWRRELRDRFGVDASIVDAQELHRNLRDARIDPDTAKFALIGSLQGARPRKGWNDDERLNELTGASTQLARFLRENSQDSPLIDLVIIDEAHYLRNPGTSTNDLGQLVRGVAEYLVLLSATPVHLKSDNLYQVLNLADPATFNQADAFDSLLAANEPLVRARDLVASGKADPAALGSLLDEAAVNPILKGSQQLRMLRADLSAMTDLADAATASKLASRLERVNLLGHVVTRTRKRDVHEWRVHREPVAEVVELSDVEREFYDAVSQVVRVYCLRSDAHEGFLQVMPQRQMCSSMPAAFRSWVSRTLPDDDATYGQFGETDSVNDKREAGPVVTELADRVLGLSSYEELKSADSKYSRLRDMLTGLFENGPREKVVLFSSFKATLEYLRERLTEDGIGTLVLHGGVDAKDSVVDTFRASPSGLVLLSSEVASEGIDLQFAWVLVNYDLPWNPMRVEQRIGRLDRLGQLSDKIAIRNLFYADTIDERIYRRLYERLGIFERSLGAIEPILGDDIQRLAIDLLRQDLTPEQQEQRIEQTTMAIENRRTHEEQLEAEAAHLVAYGDYIVNQINANREMGRQISASDLCSYVTEFLASHYAGCVVRRVSEALDYEISLSTEAKHDLELFLDDKKLRGATNLARSDSRSVACRFENTVERTRKGSSEVISQLHPIVRFVTASLKAEADLAVRPAVAIVLEKRLAPLEIGEGTYVFAVERWSMTGLQETEYLYYSAAGLRQDSVCLPADTAEKLIVAAATHGRDWIGCESDVDLNQAYEVANEVCMTAAQSAYAETVTELRAQNDDRAEVQERIIEQTLKDQRRQLEETRDKYLREGRPELVQLPEGRIAKLEERMARKLLEVSRRRGLDHRSEDVCVGVVRVSATGGSKSA